MSSYYQLLNANGQRRSAEVSLENARAVQQASEARLQNGLATLPDVLGARSAAAQAEYELQSTIGMQETASGDLATLLTASPASQFRIRALTRFTFRTTCRSLPDDLIKQALAQRPDLLARLLTCDGHS